MDTPGPQVAFPTPSPPGCCSPAPPQKYRLNIKLPTDGEEGAEKPKRGRKKGSKNKSEPERGGAGSGAYICVGRDSQGGSVAQEGGRRQQGARGLRHGLGSRREGAWGWRAGLHAPGHRMEKRAG